MAMYMYGYLAVAVAAAVAVAVELLRACDAPPSRLPSLQRTSSHRPCPCQTKYPPDFGHTRLSARSLLENFGVTITASLPSESRRALLLHEHRESVVLPHGEW